MTLEKQVNSYLIRFENLSESEKIEKFSEIIASSIYDCLKNYGEDLVVYKKNVYNYVNGFKSNFEIQVWQILSYSSNLDEVKENVYKFLKKRKIKKAILGELKNNPIFVNQILANSKIKDCIKKYGKFKI